MLGLILGEKAFEDICEIGGVHHVYAVYFDQPVAALDASFTSRTFWLYVVSHKAARWRLGNASPIDTVIYGYASVVLVISILCFGPMESVQIAPIAVFCGGF